MMAGGRVAQLQRGLRYSLFQRRLGRIIPWLFPHLTTLCHTTDCRGPTAT